MNALRRKALAQALDLLEQANEIIEQIQEEEQEAYDNLPENLLSQFNVSFPLICGMS